MFFDTVSDLVRQKHGIPLQSIHPEATVADAVRIMKGKDIGAVLVMNGAGLEGILTERDVIRRVVDPAIDPATTPVRQVMAARPITVAAGERAARALELMVRHGCSHLPVTEGSAVSGVLSMRDLNDWLTRELQTQTDQALMAVKTMGLANRGR